MVIEIGDNIHYKWRNPKKIGVIHIVKDISLSKLDKYTSYIFDNGEVMYKNSIVYNDIMKNYQKYGNVIAKEDIIREIKIKEILE